MGAALGLVQIIGTIAFAWFLTRLIVGVADGRDLANSMGDLGFMAGVIILRAFALWGMEVAAARGAVRVKSQLRRQLVTTIGRLGPGWLTHHRSAQITALVGSGLDALDDYFGRYLPQLILSALATPILVVVIFAHDMLSGLVLVVTVPMIPVFMVLVGQATQAAQQRQWDRVSRLSVAFLDMVGGLSTLKLFGRHHRQEQRIITMTDAYRVETMKILRMSFLSGFVLELAASLSVALVAVSIGLRLLNGDLSLTIGLFVLLLTPEVFSPVRQVGAFFHAATDGIDAATEVFGILDADPGEHRQHPAPSHPNARFDSGGRVGHPMTPLPGATLELNNLSVTYDGRVAVHIPYARCEPGTITAVVGPSGAGKSTLLRALLGFVPFSGCVRFGARECGDNNRHWIAWAGQRPVLMRGTVAANVALGSLHIDQALVRRTLDLAAIPDIATEKLLSVTGSGLSVGQAQRVAIARALYRAIDRRCQVIVLDEPTSALDSDTEKAVMVGLRTLAIEGHSIIVVSHRPAVVNACDAVLALGTNKAVVT